MLHKLFTIRSYLKQSIVFDIFFKITCNKSLSNDRVPQFIIIIHPNSEQVQIFMLMVCDFLCLPSHKNIDDIISPEILFYRKYKVEHVDELVLRFNLRLRVQAIITITTVFL